MYVIHRLDTKLLNLNLSFFSDLSKKPLKPGLNQFNSLGWHWISY